MIATLLGPDRTAEELIPMLSELIDKIDCNAELMMHLSEQLGELAPLLSQTENADEHLQQLLEPLETVIGNDDQVVRDKAVASMQKTAALLSS